MAAYIVLVLYILLMGLCIEEKYKNNRKFYCVSVCAFIILFLGIRGHSLGINDVALSYVPIFEKMGGLSFADIIFSETMSDKGFYIFTKAFSLICSSTQLYLLAIAIPLPVAVSMLIYKKSSSPMASFLAFLGLGFFGFSFFLLRQVIAVAFCIFAYLCDDSEHKHKKTYTFLLFAIAATFHISSLIFAISYYLLKCDIFTKKAAVVSCASVLFGLVGGGLFFEVFVANSNWSRLTYLLTLKTELNNTTLYIFLLVFILAVLLAVLTKNKNKEINFYLLMLGIGVFFTSLSKYMSDMYRMGIYYNIFAVVLCPNIYFGKFFSNRMGTVIKIAFSVVMVVYFLANQIWNANIAPFVTFWR